MIHIMILMGTRPEIIKCAPLIRKITKDNFKLTLIHSGQHYDYEMSNIFLKELGLPQMQANLEIGSGTHGEQTAKMLLAYEKKLLEFNPDIVLAEGDTNSVVAASIVCSKLNIPFGHIEAGIRSYDLTMPEEINRKIADSVSALFFAPTKQAILNLLYEGADPKRVFLTGNTIVDATLEHSKIAIETSKIIEELSLPNNKEIITLTVHRANNVDERKNLEQICKGVMKLEEFIIVFPIHPRTNKKLIEFGFKEKLEKKQHIILTNPLGYLDFLCLMKNSKVIVTDSGGLQEEAICLGKPCVTLRKNTERPETVKLGLNVLVGANTIKLIKAVRNFVRNEDEVKKQFQIVQNPYGDGKASEKILKIIKEKYEKNDLIFKKPEIIPKGAFDFKLIVLKATKTISEIEKEYQGKVTLIYDNKGQPQIFSNNSMKIPAKWYVRIQY